MNDPQVPKGFRDELQKAKQENQPARLMLLGLEAHGSRWESAGLRLVDEALLKAKYGVHSPLNLVILFTGHRIDSAGRKTPRFPPAMEAIGRKASKGCVGGTGRQSPRRNIRSRWRG